MARGTDLPEIVVEPLELEAGPVGMALDADPETSMVESLQLHLMSEHGVADALHMDERDARQAHERLHVERAQNHAVSDYRFRPLIALSTMMLDLQRREHVLRLAVPAPRLHL